jgi:hypothetical protein
MTSKQAKVLASDDVLLKRVAKLMAQQCFRNTELENLHSGKGPSSKSGDYSDVKVVSPFGEIPWPELSRLSDEEMKVLMVEVVNKTYSFLMLLFKSSPATLDKRASRERPRELDRQKAKSCRSGTGRPPNTASRGS